MDGCMDGWMDGRMNGWMDGWMDPASRLCSPSASLIPTHALNPGTLAPLDPKAENPKHPDHMPRLDCPSVSAETP